MSAGISVEGQRHRSTGARTRYAYYLPFTGEVCRIAFQTAYNVSNDILNRYRKQVKEGRYAVPQHGNRGNKNAKFVDEDALKAYFSRLADVHADVVPVRFRHQKTKDGVVHRYFTIKEYRLLPSYFTWAMMHDWYIKWAEDARVRVKEPSLSSFQSVLEKVCPTIRVRSPRDNVCDACVIYRNTMGPEPSVEDTEAAASHIADAKAMRRKYKSDCDAATPNALVTTIDFAQNITLPHNASTPSLWYFLSLISVSVFGIHSHPDKLQWNLIYSERKAKKGSTEVISMLDTYARTRNIYSTSPGSKTWHVYADNCGGHVKNSYVLQFLLFLVHTRSLEGATLSFLVKGHTKNHCDRHFGYIKRHYAKRNLWVMEDVERAVQESAPDNRCINLELSDQTFREFKETLTSLYNKLKQIQSYQIFDMRAGEPGVVYCRKRPTSKPVVQNLLKGGVSKEFTESERGALWASFKKLDPPPLNKEKVHDIYKKVLPYVPPELRSDPLYIVPDAEDVQEVVATKRARRRKAPVQAQDAVRAEPKKSSTNFKSKSVPLPCSTSHSHST